MDSSSIELPGSEIDGITLREGSLRVHFSRAHIVKSMTGSDERTRWWQAGDLILDGAQVDGGLPSGPLICGGGDVDENVYTYRDMIPLPLNGRGRVRCELHFRNSDAYLIVTGETVRLEMTGDAKYIEHMRPGDG